MELMTQEVRERLLPLYTTEGWKWSEVPVVVKYFTPWSDWTWWAWEWDGTDLLFGLVSGMEKELGYFSLSELKSVQGPLGLGIERDIHFSPKENPVMLDQLLLKEKGWVQEK